MCFVHCAQFSGVLRHFQPVLPPEQHTNRAVCAHESPSRHPVFVHNDKKEENNWENLAFGYNLFTIMRYNIYVYFVSEDSLCGKFKDTMQSQGSKVKIYRTGTLILCAVGFAAYLASYLIAGDGSDYFSSNQILPKIATGLSVAAILWFLSALVRIPKNTLPTEDFMRGKPCIAAAFPIIGTLGTGAIGMSYLDPTELAAILVRQRPIDTNAICTLLVAVGTLLSIGYYALRAINSPKTNNAAVVLGLGPVSLLTGLCGLTYFELDHHMNAPAKLGLQLAFVATMLYLTAELRYLLDRAQPRRYLSSACLALFANTCALAGAFPALLNPTQTVHGVRILAFALLCLCNGAYIAYRLFSFSAHCQAPVTPDVPAIPKMPEQTGKDDQEDGCEQQDPMAS